MNRSWFPIENNLIDRVDLNIYEKMCCVVLARYANREEFNSLITNEIIALKMGCSVEVANAAIRSLIDKRLLAIEDTRSGDVYNLQDEEEKDKKVIIRNAGTEIKTFEFEEWHDLEEDNNEASGYPVEDASVPDNFSELDSFFKASLNDNLEDNPSDELWSEEATGMAEMPDAFSSKTENLSFEEKVERVHDIIQERINDREARIILSFAEGDLDLVREKYKIAALSQMSDKMEVLINELQKGSAADADDADVKASMASNDDQSENKKKQNGQINLQQIHKMKMYNMYGNKK